MNCDTWTSASHVRPPSREARNQVLNGPARLSCQDTYTRPASPPTITGNTSVDPVVSVGTAIRSVQPGPSVRGRSEPPETESSIRPKRHSLSQELDNQQGQSVSFGGRTRRRPGLASTLGSRGRHPS